MTTINVYLIATQILSMYEAGGFAQTGDLGSFVQMVKRARRLCIEACHDTQHPAVLQIEQVLDLAIRRTA
nr:MAG TPA: hypothetical protein [Caudoviricetes sp.]